MTPSSVYRSPSKRRPPAAPSHPAATRPMSVLLQFQRGNTRDPVIIIVDNDNDAEDNIIILSGVSVICCRRRCRCRPPSMVGCCVAHSAVCPYRRPSPATARCSCPMRPSPPTLLSMVGCCFLCPPSSIPTESPS